ncbi:MAG: heterodisulfide reductase subunit F [bacterium]|nr:heterodisulfide reductase subunit F [bacterium]
MSTANPYRPRLMRIADLHEETADVRTLELEFAESDVDLDFASWKPGQFGEFTVFGHGECVFAISNAPPSNGHAASQPDPLPTIECTFRSIGKVTTALRRLGVDGIIGFRGPYGNSFPVEDWYGKDLVFIGGGIGMVALRSPLLTVLRQREIFGDIAVLNGARTVADIVYCEEMEQWSGYDGVDVVRTVDPGGETPDWDGKVGLIPQVFKEMELAPDGRVVVACGPPVMLHFLFLALKELGYSPDQVVTTLENKMKCGIGHCGRCNVGPFYVCRDGPVVTWQQLNELPNDF